MVDDRAAEGAADWDAWFRTPSGQEWIDEVLLDPEVCRVVAQVLATGTMPETGPWGWFGHVHGHAEVLAMLPPASAPSPEAVRARASLWDMVRDPDVSRAFPALAVPDLIQAAAYPTMHLRADLLLLAAEAGHRYHFGVDRRDGLLQVRDQSTDLRDRSGVPVALIQDAARTSITEAVPLLIPLLDDADVDVRCAVAYALATALAPPAAVPDALRARLAVEDDEAARTSLVLGLTQLALEEGDASVVVWTESLWADERNPVDLRFAGAVAWLCATTAPPPRRLRDLLAAATTPATQRWIERVPWPDDIAGHGGLAAWLAAFLDSGVPR